MNELSLCYEINSFAWFLFPGFAGKLFPFILVPCFIAELSMPVATLQKSKHFHLGGTGKKANER